MAAPQIHPSVLDFAMSSLAHDQAKVNDFDTGTFFTNVTYLAELPDEAKRLICAIQHQGDHPDRPLLSFGRAVEYFKRWMTTKNLEYLRTCHALGAVSVIYTPKDSVERHFRIHCLARWLQSKWEVTNEPSDLDATIHFYDRAASAIGPGNADYSAYATDLAVLLNKRWNRNQALVDYDAARRWYLVAIESGRESPFLPVFLSNYGELLRLKASFSSDRRLETLTESVSRHDEAISLDMSHLGPHTGTIWRNRGMAHGDLLHLDQSREHFTQTILSCGKAIEKTPKTAKMFGECFHYLFGICQKQALRDITFLSTFKHASAAGCNKPITIMCKLEFLKCGGQNLLSKHLSAESRELSRKYFDFALNEFKLLAYHRDDTHLSEVMMWRGSLLYFQMYEHLEACNRENLDRAILFSHIPAKFDLHSPVWHSMLFEFSRWKSELLKTRYELQGDRKDIDQAINLQQAMIESKIPAANDVDLALSTWYLGKCFKALYNVLQDIDSLKAALTYFRAVTVAGITFDAYDNALIHNDLANSFSALFDSTGDHSDLKEAILIYELTIFVLRQSKASSAEDDIRMLFTGLGTCMLRRALHWNSEEDVRAAIFCFRKTLAGINHYYVRFAQRTANLCYALHVWFSIDRDTRHLIESQRLLTAALANPSSLMEAELQTLEVHLANTFLYFYSKSENLSDIDLAIKHFDLASTIAGGKLGNRVDAAQNGAYALFRRAESTKSRNDYDASLKKFDDAAKIAGKSDRASIRLGRAKVLHAIYETFGDQASGREALILFSDLAKDDRLSPTSRVHSAATAAMLENDIEGDNEAAFQHIILCVKLMPTAVLLFASRLEQLRFIREIHYVSSNAAALAATAGREASECVSLLEHSRSVLWNRLLEADDPLEQVRQRHPGVAKKMNELRAEMTGSGQNEIVGGLSGFIPEKDQIRLRKHHAWEEYAKLNTALMNDVEPSSLMNLVGGVNHLSLSQKASVGPVVFVNFSSYRSDAFVVSADSTYCIELSTVSMQSVKENALSLRYSMDLMKSKSTFDQAKDRFDEVMSWLWIHVARPILDSIQFTAYPEMSNGKTRLFWVTTGWISTFPIHAAGLYGAHATKPGTVENCAARVTSSYIPSLRAFEKMVANAATCANSDHLGTALIVGMPYTPGMAKLSAKDEVESVERCIGRSLKITTLIEPKFAEATAHFQTSELIHLACHGVADQTDPSLSAICLSDWRQKPLSVRAILRMKLAGCRLAMLSACETATNKDLLTRDEGLHLAGAFHMVGVQHTIATLWSVSDELTVKLVNEFYTQLRGEDGRLQYSNSAVALHDSVERMREEGWPPILWACYMHCGP